MSNRPLMPPVVDAHIRTLIRLAVGEDMGLDKPGVVGGDRTVELAIPEKQRAVGTVVARRAGVVSGTFLIGPILAEYDRGMEVTVEAADGSRVAVNQPIARITGPARALLSAERVLLNFLGHLSGIATMTRRYVDAVAGLAHPPAICDIRKTTPGFRALDKYAVRCGGGVNHRMGLYDGVMLKDNHLVALRDQLGQSLTLAQLTSQIRAKLAPAIMLWLEVDTLEQLAEALPGGGADIILLDNFSVDQMRRAVELRNAYHRTQHSALSTQNFSPLLESSGGITLETLPSIAQTGIDRISIGALTHSAPVLDLSMELE